MGKLQTFWKMMKLIGYWKEDGGRFMNMPSLHELIRLSQYDDKELILAYLQQSSFIVASPGLKKSLLDDEMIGLGIQSDGTWAWPASLYYYLKTYDVLLDTEFVEHVRSAAYKVPFFNEERLILISTALRNTMLSI
jgi:hypothetical protein